MPALTLPGAPDSLQSAWGILLNFGTDFFALIVVTAIVAIFAFYFGNDRLAPLIAGLYAAIPIYEAFPYGSYIGTNPYVEIGVYLLFAVLGMVAFSGLSYFMASGGIGFFRALLLSFLTAGFLIAVSIHLLPVQNIYLFSQPTHDLFASNIAFFWWLVAPLAGIFFLGRG